MTGFNEVLHPSTRQDVLLDHPLRPLLILSTDTIWLPEEGSMYRDLVVEGAKIGSFELDYRIEEKAIRPHIYLDSEYRKLGIGRAAYGHALSIPMPDGRMPRKEGFTLVSSGQTASAKGLWEGFVRRKQATRGEMPGHYEMR